MTDPAASSEGGSAPASVLSTPPPAPAAPAAEVKPTYEANDWRASLPDDLRAEPSLKVINDIPAMVKSYIHAQKLVGADKVPLPSKHATDEDWQKFYDKLGRPPPDKYEIKSVKDSKFIDAETIKELTPIAHKAGVMPQQLDKILAWYDSRLSGQQAAVQKAQEKQVEEGIAGLKKEWGKAYDQQVGYATHLLKEKGDPELVKWLDESGMGNNPHLIKAFAKLGAELYGEDKIAGEGAGGKSMYTPAAALQKAKDIMADSSHPYSNPEHPNHRAAVQEVQDLYQMAYITEAKT